jgi:hypothetical protein
MMLAAAPARPVIAQIAKQFDQHPLVMIGELHRWQQLHAFIQELIHDRAFICRADDVVVEFGNSRLQDIADVYSSGGDVSEAQLQSLWRETAVPLTWNSPVYRQFYEAIRDINAKHRCKHSLRIVLADPPLDWSKIKTVKEYQPWTDRDGSYAAVVEREVLARHHRAFLLAGQYHVVKQTPEGERDEARAAQLIERRHPGALFSIVAASNPAAAAAMHLEPAPSFKVIQGSDLETADSGMINPDWPKLDPAKKRPPLGEVVDGVLNVGEQTLIYPPPTIYLDPVYQAELRRHATIIKEYSGQDFLTVIDDLVKQATQH